MKLTKLTYENLKGRSETVALGDANIVYGPNFAGKTTIIDAVKLLLLGYHPALDKMARGVFELSSGSVMDVIGEFTEEKKTANLSIAGGKVEVARKWSSDGNKVSRKDYLPVNWPEIPASLLDAGAYFGATDRQRVEMLFKAAKINTSITLGEINSALAAFGVQPGPPLGTHQEFIEKALQHVEQMRSEAAAGVRRMKGTLQGLSALQLADAAPPSSDAVAEMKRKRDQYVDARLKVQEAERALRSAEVRSAVPQQSLPDVDGAIARRQQAADRWKKVLSGKIGKLFCTNCVENAKQIRDDELNQIDEQILALENQREVTVKANDEQRAKALKKQKRAISAANDALMKAEERLLAVKAEFEAVEAAERRHVANEADRKRLAEAREALQRHEADEKNYGEAKKYLLQLKEQMVAMLFAPILRMAERFTHKIFTSPLSFENGELGMRIMDNEREIYQWIPHRTFSGTEQAIAFAALQAALGASSPIKLVVMDEIDRIDARNKAQLLKNVLDAIDAGAIEQFIGVSTVPVDHKRFTLIERTHESKRK